MIDGSPLEQYLDQQVRRHREALIRQATSLGEDLLRLAERLTNGSPVVSELGEVQSRGTMLDARCASYVEASEALKAYRAFAIDAQIGR